MAVIATGFFDGVHLGHRQVLDTLVSCAHEMGQEAIVITFSQHPRMVLGQDAESLRLLNSPSEKRELLLKAGVDRVEYVDFTPQFAAMCTEEYLRYLKSRFDASAVVIGYDNRIGSDQLTPDDTARVAQKLGLIAVIAGAAVPSGECATLGAIRGGTMQRSGMVGSATADVPRGELLHPATTCPGETAAGSRTAISSTRIRVALAEGKIGEANAMLGYCYSLRGTVVHGNKIGRTLGYPTANIGMDDALKQVPASGVYLVQVLLNGQSRWGMTNIGMRPTVGGSALTVETHIFDFSDDIYGQEISVRFMERLRSEQRFSSLDQLKNKLAADEVRCREMLNNLQ